MGLRINTNIAALNAQKHLEKTTNELGSTLERLSSGKRIVKAGDDAASLAMGETLRAKERSLVQAGKNTSLGVSLVQTAEGGLNEVSNLLIRMQELAIQASSDTIGETERGFVNTEFQKTKEEINRIAEVTEFNGTSLLNGKPTNPELNIQVGPSNDPNHAIKFNAAENDARPDTLGVGGSAVDVQGSALTAIDEIKNALNKVSMMRASLGAEQNRLQSVRNTLDQSILSTADARSVLTDADVAEETANLAREQIKHSAGTAVLAQANNMPAMAIKLLG